MGGLFSYQRYPEYYVEMGPSTADATIGLNVPTVHDLGTVVANPCPCGCCELQSLRR